MGAPDTQPTPAEARRGRRRGRKARGDRVHHRAPPGAAPGTIIIDPEALRPVIRIIAYAPGCLVERLIKHPREIPEFFAENSECAVHWVNVDGLGDAEILRQIGEVFGLHRLALEDVVNVHQRPKTEPYAEHTYIVVRMLEPTAELIPEQISIFLGRNYVLTFQERPGDCWDPVRERLRHAKGRLRGAGADYLTYALIDSVIDGYFPVLERYSDRIEEIEARILEKPDAELVEQLYRIKRDLLVLRRIAWSTREAVNAIMRDESGLVAAETRVYLRDLYDHAVQVLDMLETYRELASGQVDLYLSMIGQKTNEVMKVLTMIATIFIPLSFIAGLYGMNFEHDDAEHPLNMPELEWAFGYPAVLLVMAGIAVAMLFFFRHKGWIGSRRTKISAPARFGQSNTGDRGDGRA
jgi:magnesium transporter